MTDHIVRSFSDELDQLSADLLRMGGLVESMIVDACRAINQTDRPTARMVIDRDREVDAIDNDVEQRITRLLALRQPMAIDLREVLSSFRISHELERIGDLAKNIAKRVDQVNINDRGVLTGVQRMGNLVAGQLHNVLNALANRDETSAAQVWRADADVDSHYNSYFREVLTYMMEDPRTISAGAHLLFIAKNLERIGDHCTNVAENVHYIVTGLALDGEQRPKANDIEPEGGVSE